MKDPESFYGHIYKMAEAIIEGVMEGCCPPHYTDMRAAVYAACERKFGQGGPFHPDTPGPPLDGQSQGAFRGPGPRRAFQRMRGDAVPICL